MPSETFVVFLRPFVLYGGWAWTTSVTFSPPHPLLLVSSVLARVFAPRAAVQEVYPRLEVRRVRASLETIVGFASEGFLKSRNECKSVGARAPSSHLDSVSSRETRGGARGPRGGAAPRDSGGIGPLRVAPTCGTPIAPPFRVSKREVTRAPDDSACVPREGRHPLGHDRGGPRGGGRPPPAAPAPPRSRAVPRPQRGGGRAPAPLFARRHGVPAPAR